ncbi:hypothetical protein LINPERHAP2_LOCUS32637 [Linum perenne]
MFYLVMTLYYLGQPLFRKLRILCLYCIATAKSQVRK